MTKTKPTEKSGTIFQTVLAATADAYHNDSTVTTAARLAQKQSAQLHIVHAVPLISVLDKSEDFSAPADRKSSQNGIYSQSAISSLMALYADHFPKLTSKDIFVTTGVPWEAVFRTAQEAGSDLIVVGPHTSTGKIRNMDGERGFMGGTADGVIRLADCPVMIVSQSNSSHELTFKNIIVGMDFSPSCAAAVCMAAVIARYTQAFIFTFHMLPIAPYPKYSPQAIQAERIRLQRRMNTICLELLGGIGHQYFVKPGARPFDELLRFAHQVKADLIIMGSHTKERRGKWYSGSVVQQVACQAACPVIVVNGPGALSPWQKRPAVAGCFSKMTNYVSRFKD